MNTQPNVVSASALLNLSRPERLADTKLQQLQQGEAFRNIFAAEAAVKAKPEVVTKAEPRTPQSASGPEPGRSKAEQRTRDQAGDQQGAAVKTEQPRKANASGAAEDSASAADKYVADDRRVEQNAAAVDRLQEGDEVNPAATETATPLVNTSDPADNAALTLNLPGDKNLSLLTVSDALAGLAGELEERVVGGEDPLAALIAMIADTQLDPSENPAAAVAATVLPNGGKPVGQLAVGQSSILTNGLAAALSEEGGEALFSELPLAELASGLKAESLAARGEAGKFGADSGKPADASLLAQLAAQNAPQPATSKAFSSQLLEAVKASPEGSQARANLGANMTDTQLPASARRPAVPGQGGAQFTLPNELKGALGQPQWQTAIAERVAIMATKRLSSAEIQLDPPELGHLQVKVTLNQDQASVSFASPHSVVREALDQTLFRLREMFEAEGFNLLDVDVSDQSFQQGQEQQEPGAEQLAGEAEAGATELEVVATSNQLVDQFV